MILRRRRRRRGSRPVTAILIILLAGWLILEAQIRPRAKVIVKNKAAILSSDVIDSAITEVICDSGITYDDIIITTYNAQHEIQAINTNITKVNELKADLSTHIHKRLGEVENRKISIPVGNFSGTQLLEGKGFDIDFTISLTGSAEVNLNSNFTSAGINQTRHTISMNINANITVLNSAWVDSININTDAIIAEMIIVGTVPELYAQK